MWFWHALASALFFSLSVIVSKSLVSKLGSITITWALFTLSLPFLLILLLYQGIPSVTPAFFLAVAGSGMVFIFAKLIEIRSLNQRSIHHVYPLTIFSTVFTYILGVFIFGEIVSSSALIGMFITLIGAYVLNVDKAKEGFFEPIIYLFRDKFSLIVILAMLLTSISSVFDKIALLNVTGDNVAFTVFWENLIMSSVLTVVLYRRNAAWFSSIKKYIWVLVLMSFLYALNGIFTFNAFTEGTLALTSAVKRTQVLWVMIFGIIFFQEKPPKHAWIATFLMILGVFLLRLES